MTPHILDPEMAAALEALAERCRTNSVRWFPHLHDDNQTLDSERLKHMALGLAEEAGEVAGVIKKMTGYRPGQSAHSGADPAERLGSEMVDVLVYLLNLAADQDIDLFAAYLVKEGACNDRWGWPE